MDIEHTSKISTLEVTVGQQTIQINRLEERLSNAQVVLDEKIDIILRLQKEIEELQEIVEGDLTTCSVEAWGIVDEQVIEIKKLQDQLTAESLILHDRRSFGYTGVIETEDTPTDVSDIYREKYPSVFQPVPYPYTHPIRDIGTSGSIKVKK